ncbi:MAG: hypothetical protein M3458_04590 [Acidobacteriota bacterium]|nr:hypothetical protein [Acidobacteriota bacterium]
MKFIVVLLIVLMLWSIGVAQDLSNAPKSKDYPVKQRYVGKPAPVVLESKRARLYRSVLREGAKKSANFASHYTVVAWGCGLGAMSMAVIDAKTGKAYFPPFECVDGSDFGLPYADTGNNPAFRVDSKLFVVYGSPDSEKPSGLYFYVFDRNRFKLVHFVEEKR